METNLCFAAGKSLGKDAVGAMTATAAGEKDSAGRTLDRSVSRGGGRRTFLGSARKDANIAGSPHPRSLSL